MITEMLYNIGREILCEMGNLYGTKNNKGDRDKQTDSMYQRTKE